ncbi:VrrA/YqfQ family protein [Terrilactibacillus sp. S3-3]|nr:VrrA/YqfQ family protein [Terrilactibacillus sp. S3-3]
MLSAAAAQGGFRRFKHCQYRLRCGRCAIYSIRRSRCQRSVFFSSRRRSIRRSCCQRPVFSPSRCRSIISLAGGANSRRNQRHGGTGLNLMGMFTNVQKAINTAQTVIPMVQKFGPIVKNAPALIGMLKSFKEINAASETENVEEKKEEKSDESETEEQEVQAEQEEKNDRTSVASPSAEQKKKAKRKIKKVSFELEEDELVSRPSKPRMYI